MKNMSTVALAYELEKDGFANAASVATLLIEAFRFAANNGRIFAHECVKAGVCKDGRFQVWRDELVKKGWLCWNKVEADLKQNWAEHSKGGKLHDFEQRQTALRIKAKAKAKLAALKLAIRYR